MGRNYKTIRAWILAKELTLFTYKITQKFPREEIYGLTSQIRRATVSIAANIAEGASRQHKKDYLNFLYNANGSLAETECLATLSYDIGYIDESTKQKFQSHIDDTAKSLFGLIRAVESEL